MCEYCKKSATKENISMTYSYKRAEDGISEAFSRVSAAMDREEFRACLSQMLLSMKIHAERNYKMTTEEFGGLLEGIQAGSRPADSFTDAPFVSMAQNPQLYN